MPVPNDASKILGGPGTLPGGIATQVSGSGVSAELQDHLTTTSGAHPATAISFSDEFGLFMGSGDVNTSLGDLSALIPPSPPTEGNAPVAWLGSALSGIPDWGILKLDDRTINVRESYTWATSPTEVFPYYWDGESPSSAFTPPFQDPVTDPTFNVTDGTYTGGGPGQAHAGFTTVASAAEPTWRIMTWTSGAQSVVVSGVAFPADRGVLALLHWPSGQFTPLGAAASSADILSRCVAAIKLGKGISDGAGCDGESGGIFSETSGSPASPFNFPGRAVGQYELSELQTGKDRILGTPIPGVTANSTAGQVRLLTDPLSSTFGTVAGGVPILGATSAGGGTDGNFFAFRLPYLSNYTALSYTPTANQPRFYSKTNITPVLSVGTPLTQAGNYPNFTANFWAFQLARYRHRFTMATGSSPRLDGTYALVHFKTEGAFEGYVRDGTVPTASQIWSTYPVTWSSISDATNLVDSGSNAALSYQSMRTEITEDSTGTSAPTLSSGSYTLTKDSAWTASNGTMTVSGVAYFIPRNNNVAPTDPHSQILSLTVNWVVAGLFGNSYYTADAYPGSPPTTPQRFRALNQNPAFVSTASFGSAVLPTVPSGVLARRQRLEYPFNVLQDGTWTGSFNPASGSTATAPATTSGITGDIANVSFSTNATVNLYVKRPLIHATGAVTGPIALPVTGGSNILFSSVYYAPGGAQNPVYGNFVTGGSVPYIPVSSLYTATKDFQEFFLDETYRYISGFYNASHTLLTEAASLNGPGLPGGMVSVDVPVRPTSTVCASGHFPGASWLIQGYHLIDLSVAANFLLSPELQVSGLPSRLPPVTEGSYAPFPPHGLLCFPVKNFSSGYRPNSGTDSVTQPTYVGCIGQGEKAYTRAFDAAMSRSASPIAASGKTSLKLKIHGVTLSDFQYTAGSPFGGIGMAIFVKVPGMTTWMDAGRLDGDGPSKQDPALDGAGCQVAGVNTFSGVDPTYNHNYAQVQVNVGPAASLFTNSDLEVPVLVRVVLYDNATGHGFNFEQGTASGPTSGCHGVIGLEIVP